MRSLAAHRKDFKSILLAQPKFSKSLFKTKCCSAKQEKKEKKQKKKEKKRKVSLFTLLRANDLLLFNRFMSLNFFYTLLYKKITIRK